MILNIITYAEDEHDNISPSSVEESKKKDEKVLKKKEEEKLRYHNWFLAHSNSKNNIKENNNEIRELIMPKDYENKTQTQYQDYYSWFERHKTKAPPDLIQKWKEEEESFIYYTKTCQDKFPLILNPKDHKEYKKIVIVIKKDNTYIKKKLSEIDKELLEEENKLKSETKLNKEIKKFKNFLLNSYRRDKSNFYKYYNYYYVFKYFNYKKEIIRKEKNIIIDLIILKGFKKIVKELQRYFEKMKKLWLLRNLIGYKKMEIINTKINERKKKYNFNKMDILLEKEEFNQEIIHKIKEIKDCVNNNNRNDYKEKIFDFIAKSLDIFKANQNKMMEYLNKILTQIKINFKKMVKENVGDTKDVQKFMEEKDSSTYIEYNYINKNNNNDYYYEPNFIYIKDENSKKQKLETEYNLYNGFEVKDYEREYKNISLDISNTFIVKNISVTSSGDKKKKEEVIYIKEKNKKYDILKNLKNIDEKKDNKVKIHLDTSNIIRTDNNNNNKEASSYHTDYFEED